MIALSRPSFLQQRLETTQPFVVVGNQLYEIHTSERLSKNRLHFLDKDHPLVEAGQLSSHERSFLDANRTSLERAAMQILIDKKREINGISAGISDLERAIQGDAAEKFVVDNVGTYYLSMQDPRIVHPGRARKQLSATEIPELRMRPFDSLLSSLYSEPLLFRTLGDKVLCAFGEVFSLQEGVSSTEYVCLGDRSYALSHVGSLRQKSQSYLAELDRALAFLVEANIENYSAVFQMLDYRRNLLQSANTGRRQVTDPITNTTFEIRNGISFENRNTYESYLTLHPFIIRKNGESYLFQQVTLRSDFSVSGNEFRLLHKPRIDEPGQYRHPFVYDSNEICYNVGIDRFRNEGVTFEGLPLRTFEDKERATILVVQNLDIARKVLQQGCIGDALHPVRFLNRSNFSHEYLMARMADLSKIGVFEN